MESLAYQVNDVLVAMKADSRIALSSLKVDGGASANNFLMQTQAGDIINVPVKRPECVETTAMGAAYLAGLAVGYWKDLEDIKNNWMVDQTFVPVLEEKIRTGTDTGMEKGCEVCLWMGKADRNIR